MARNWSILAAAALAVAFASEARADSLRPPPGQHWIAVASTKDKDTAMAIADYYSECHGRVVTSKSGWLAVVLGPYAGKSIAAIQKEHSEIIDLPKDARLSNGDSYVDTVWQSKPWAESRPLSSYSTGKPAQFSSGGLTFKVEMQGDEDNPGPTHAVAAQGSTGVFSFETPNEYSQFESNAGLVRLDPATDAPQLVFTRYTGGAHCCTETWIVSSPKDGTGWTLIDTGPLDGGGYSYEDLDGDGALELVHPDNDFLYAFDSYAGSYAPVRVQQLRGGKLVDVSDMDAFRPVLRRDLARMEFEAKLDPGLWKSNGFLAGWLAAKMRLGQGEEAWQVVSENLESGTDFGPMICTSAKEPNDLENCPDQDQVRVPIRKALAQFLNERDYGELPQGALAAMN